MTSKTFVGRSLVQGDAKGAALVSRRAFTFAHGVDPETGEITDVRSDICGSNVKGAVLLYPFGKGSTTASSWFLETVRRGNGPAAIITGSIDLAPIIGSVLAKLLVGKSVPVLTGFDESFFGEISNGDNLEVGENSVEVSKVT